MPDALISIAQHYHDRTKYDPQILETQAQPLDYSRQPQPFKTYRVGAEIDLKPYLDVDNPQPGEHQIDWMRLSRLLINTYGLTAKFPTATGQTFYLRSAPSAGGLYPAEVYLISRGNRLLPAGLYNYQVRSHTLWRYWDDHCWQGLQQACFWHPALEATHLALVVTGVFYRSAWRYRDRAYRRICLDAGHLLGNLELASTLVDFRPHLIASFADRAVADLLYLDPVQEGALAVLPLADLLTVEQNLPYAQVAFATPAQTNFDQVPDGELLSYFHRVIDIAPTAKVPSWAMRPTRDTPQSSHTRPDKYNLPFGLRVPMATTPITWGAHLGQLETALVKRRSTRRYSGKPITLADLKHLLDFTYQPHHYRDQGFDPDPDYGDRTLVHTFIVACGVTALDEGCYYYSPGSEELRQVRFKNFRRELHYLCLGQELGRDAAAVIIHTADLKAAVEAYGDRVYRYLHMDAGHLGQRLNLAATRLGLGVSGIGGFYDDQVNEVLGLPADEAVIYITTLGLPG
ncbi:SagB/ThcOx family dehydrogenase [Nodosilinea sp. LEGE 07088]|uniref:SagB/ThcOx family dehydrogenase n=1 Tax=Nodosilinea sp. LEGE 07088 TaxID=2777968 RepID=UPI0018816FEB|nr:SagB/ThcOx family dehydrogenase [Nodosilinea sp. LEGE 07088]